MGKVLICTGKYAKEPYYLSNICVNVYSVEELCYLFVNNPFMIQTELMNQELISWLEEQCELKELADKLKGILRQGVQVSTFVNIILDYVNMNTPQERAGMDAVIQSNAGLNEFERYKKQADYLLESKKYQMAINEYDMLLHRIPETEGALRPLVYHNLGYAYAGLFMFDVAAKYYKRAYEITNDQESGLQYLSAVRIVRTEEEYISFIAEHAQYHQLSLMLEKKLKAAKEDFEASREKRMLSTLQIFKEEGKVTSYYEEIDKIVYHLKDDYLKLIAE